MTVPAIHLTEEEVETALANTNVNALTMDGPYWRGLHADGEAYSGDPPIYALRLMGPKADAKVGEVLQYFAGPEGTIPYYGSTWNEKQNSYCFPYGTAHGGRV